MIRIAWRDLSRNWKHSALAALLLAMPVLILTTFLSLAYSAFVVEEYPENAYTYARVSEPPREDFSPAFRGRLSISANGTELDQWVTGLSFGIAPEPGSIVLSQNSARALGVAAGDTVTVDDKPLTVASTRVQDYAIGNYADFAGKHSPADQWFASPHPIDGLTGEYVHIGHEPPKHPTEFIWVFFNNPVGLGMVLPIFALIIILTIALTAPLFTIARTRLHRTQHTLETVGTTRSVLPWEGLILGLIGAAVGSLASWPLTEAIGHWDLGADPHWGWDLALLFSLFTILSAVISAASKAPARMPRWFLVLGPALLFVGLVLTMSQFPASFTGLPFLCLGAALSGPLVLWLFTKLPVAATARIALRDALRNSHRTTAAMASITATIVAVGVLSVMLPKMAGPDEPITEGVFARANVQVESPTNYELLNELSSDYGEPVHLYAAEEQDSSLSAWQQFGIYQHTVIAAPTFIDALGLDPKFKARLQAGETLTAEELGFDKPGKLTSVRPEDKVTYQGSYFPKSPNPIQQLQLHRASQTSGMEVGAANSSESLRLVAWSIFALGIAFIVFVIALVLALSSAQSRTQRAQLQDIGTSPAVLRRYRFLQALIIAVPAILLGVVVTIVGLR